MWETRYLLAKIKYKIRGNNKEVMSTYFRKKGMVIGSNCNICCNIMTPEPYLINIGNNVTIAGNVRLVTHDNSINKVDNKCANLFGYITIGDNCFIGENAIINYGVSLASNIIVASGSVVAHSFSEERIIIGGNPASIIGTWEDFFKRNSEMAMGRIEAYEHHMNAYNNVVDKFVRRKERIK